MTSRVQLSQTWRVLELTERRGECKRPAVRAERSEKRGQIHSWVSRISSGKGRSTLLLTNDKTGTYINDSHGRQKFTTSRIESTESGTNQRLFGGVLWESVLGSKQCKKMQSTFSALINEKAPNHPLVQSQHPMFATVHPAFWCLFLISSSVLFSRKSMMKYTRRLTGVLVEGGWLGRKDMEGRRDLEHGGFGKPEKRGPSRWLLH